MQTIHNRFRTITTLILAFILLCSCGNAGKKVMQKAGRKAMEKELVELKKKLPMNVEGTNVTITDIELADDIVTYTVEISEEDWKTLSLDSEVTNSDRNLARVLASIPESSVTSFISVGLGLKYLYISAETHEVLGNLNMTPQKLKEIWDAMKSGELKAYTLIELSKMELERMNFPQDLGNGVWLMDAYIKGHNIYYETKLDKEVNPADISSDNLAGMKQGCLEGIKEQPVVMMRKKEMFDENIHLIYIYKDSRDKEFARIDLSPSDIFGK